MADKNENTTDAERTMMNIRTQSPAEEEPGDDWQPVLLQKPSLFTMLRNFLPALKEAIIVGAQTFNKRLREPRFAARGEEWPEVEWDEDPPAEGKEAAPPAEISSEADPKRDISEKNSDDNEESGDNKKLTPSAGFNLQKILITILIILLIALSVSMGLYFGGLFDASGESPQTPQQQLEAMQISYTANNFVKHAAATDLTAVELFVKAGMDIDSRRSPDGVTPLMAAVGADRKKMAEFLLVKGADIDAKDDEGQTALMRAVKFNRLHMVDFLLAEKADYTIADKSGSTVADMIKEREDSARFAEIFLKHDINISPDAPKADATTANAPAGNTSAQETQNKPAESGESAAAPENTASPEPQTQPAQPPAAQPNPYERNDNSISVYEFLKSMEKGNANTDL